MSEAPPSKKMKQTDIRHLLTPVKRDKLPKKEDEEGPSKDQQQTGSESEAKETPQASGTDQDRMDKLPKTEVEEGPSKDQQQQVEEKTFKYSLNSEPYSVACDTSMTVLDALNRSKNFRNERKKTINRDKEILIQRSKEADKAAMKTHFPVCLIENEEMLDVSFIKNDGSASTKPEELNTPKKQHLSKSDMVTFYVQNKGSDGVVYLLKNKALRDKNKYVCVYAHKEKLLKTALEQDGRFTEDIFKKYCALSEFGTESKYEMTHPVKNLDQKIFKVVVLKSIKQPDSQDDLTPEINTEPGVASDADVADGVATSQNPENTKQDQKHKNKPVKSTRPSAKWSDPKVIQNSEEILDILRNQFKGLLEQLKQRKDPKNKPKVQNFFKAEFAKSVEFFLEVKKVKELAKLSDSVCQIRVEGKPEGTGFLLFNRFILTNAHVIEPFTEHSQGRPYPCRLQKTAKIVFNFEDLQSEVIELSVKEEIFAWAKERDSNGRYLDYALLELDTEAPDGLCELLDWHSYAPPRAGSQICIVGHPGEGVKKLDPCFIIKRENEQMPTNDFYHVITQQYLEKVEETQIPYNTCFFEGSSGSPVFDEHCYLIGIHTGGFSHGEHKVIEYAFSLKPILENIQIQAENCVEENKRKFVIEILKAYTNITSM